MNSYEVQFAGGSRYEVDLRCRQGRWQATIGGTDFELRLLESDGLDRVAVEVAGERIELPLQGSSPAWGDAGAIRIRDRTLEIPSRPSKAANAEKRAIQSPMAGFLQSLLVEPGDRIHSGAPLFVLEAMKMENTITAQEGGIVAALLAQPGSTVRKGDALLQIVPSRSTDSGS